MSVRIEVGNVMAHIERMEKKAIFAATSQALADLNTYTPFEYGNLMGSSLANSVLDQGHIEWVTPYARVVWQGTRKGKPIHINKAHHPRATSKWTAVAKKAHVEQWRRIAEKAMGGK